MNPAILEIFAAVVRRMFCGLCAVLLSAAVALPQPAFGLSPDSPPVGAATEKNDDTRTALGGKALADLLEFLAENAGNLIKKADPPAPPPRQTAPPPKPATPPESEAVIPSDLGRGFLSPPLPNSAARALIRAMNEDDPETIDELVADGFDVNTRGEGGITPLHYAAGLDRPDVIAALIRHGAKVNARTVDGMTPLDYALLLNNYAAAAALHRAGGRRGAY